MDTIKKYEMAILAILSEYEKIKYANLEGKNHLIADTINHRYQVVTLGWQNDIFVHSCPMHFEIINGKIWIQQNMTEWEVGQLLEAHGVPKSDIVPGFLRPSMRAYSGYAVS